MEHSGYPVVSSSTSLSLIHRALKKEETAWSRMDAIYSPLVYQWCRRKGLQSQDAVDVVQEVMAAVSASLNTYEKTDRSASFRRWLGGIVTKKIADHYRGLAKRPEITVGEGLDEMFMMRITDDDSSEEMVNDQEDCRFVVHRTLMFLKGEYSELHWNAFWRTTIDGQSAPAVAAELNIKPGAVRQIKFRVLRRLRDELAELEHFEDQG